MIGAPIGLAIGAPLSVDYQIAAEHASFALLGHDVVLIRGNNGLELEIGSFVFTGMAVTLRVIVSVTTAVSIGTTITRDATQLSSVTTDPSSASIITRNRIFRYLN